MADLLQNIMEQLKTLDASAGGAVVLLLLSALLAVLGRFLIAVLNFGVQWRERTATQRDQERHLREVLVDIMIDADFMNSSIAEITAPDRIKALKSVIGKAEPSFRAYVASVHDDPTFDEYRGIRRQLNIQLMAACDRYFDLSQLFHLYYEMLDSDAFANLTKTRKLAAIDELCVIGQRTRDAHDTLRTEMQKSDKSCGVFYEVRSYLRKQRENEEHGSEEPAE